MQPAGLLTFLETEETVPETDVEEDKLNFRDNLKFAIQHSKRTRKNVIEKHLQGIKHWGMNLIEQQDGAAQALKNRPVVLRNRRQKKKTSDAIVNLPYFFYNFAKDHSLPNLIWNHKVSIITFSYNSPNLSKIIILDARGASHVS